MPEQLSCPATHLAPAYLIYSTFCRNQDVLQERSRLGGGGVQTGREDPWNRPSPKCKRLRKRRNSSKGSTISGESVEKINEVGGLRYQIPYQCWNCWAEVPECRD